MHRKLIIFVFCISILVFSFCEGGDQQSSQIQATKSSSAYLNHSDSARYVGMNTCKLCHQGIYNTFIKTGMGRSFDLATKAKSAADFSKSFVDDKIAELHYQAFWMKDSLFIREFRCEKKDTVFMRTEQVNYIIGSGQHTNSHLQVVNGYVNQMPMTYYTQRKQWDLPPGFENGVNTRFSRKIGLECMSCHNAYPDFVMGSENKFTRLPSGIDCERCHGPGSIHVAQRRGGNHVDTSKFIDYSIVNPAKLPIDAQFDICQRCHLQGNAILKEGKSFYDFKPGQKLSTYLSVFLPKYKNADDEFIMASHADRLKQSPCFIKSLEKVNARPPSSSKILKPYRDAMTCVTCHNPHISVRETNRNVFNDACLKCHAAAANSNQPTAAASFSLQEAHKHLPRSGWNNCVGCHMPISGSTDIPHVTVHDHYIRKPISTKERDKIKTFLGLFSINEKNPGAITRATAYIDQYEKFEQVPAYLDSAQKILQGVKDKAAKGRALIQLHFVRRQYDNVLSRVNELGEQYCFDSLCKLNSYDNRDAWTAYRIAESFYNTEKKQNAIRWFAKASTLAPYNLDFRSKLGSTLAETGNIDGAIKEFEYILAENPKVVAAYSNLGYIKLVQGYPAEAKRLYKIGEKLDPDNEPLLLNLAGYYLYMGDRTSAKKYLIRVLKKNPGSQKAKMALARVNA